MVIIEPSAVLSLNQPFFLLIIVDISSLVG
jgi:hypothetical protein